MEREKEERKNKSETEKAKQKAARDDLNRYYGYAIVDGTPSLTQAPSRRSTAIRSNRPLFSRVAGSTPRPGASSHASSRKN
jgi:hypothetical protein